MRIQLALAAQNKWKVRTADVTAAFLQSNMLSRDVFVKPVKEADAQGKLWRLLKPMYELGDSSRQWYLTIAENLKQLGCRRLDTDHAVFYFKEHGRLKGIITMHVDDLCISGNAEFDERVMKPIFNIFKFGSITEDERFALLGWNVVQDREGIVVSQQDYIDQKIEFMNIPTKGRGGQERLNDEEKALFRAHVGKLRWCTDQTRLDIAFETLLTSTAQSAPTINDVRTINKVQQLKGLPVSLRFPVLEDANTWFLT